MISRLKVSVIIPAYNAEKTIEKTLNALISQNYPKNKYEIIVVDDGSTDRTVEIVKKFENVKLILQKHAGPAVARNRGVKYAKGDILLFTDADCIPSKNWIRNMVEPFKNKKIVAVSGTYRMTNSKNIISRFINYEIEDRHKTMAKNRLIDFVSTFSAAYRKNVFLEFGGFDENFQRASCEDTDLSFKISKAKELIVFTPNAYVYHYHPETLGTMLKKKFWMGYWRVFLYKKHIDKLFRHSYTPKMVFLEEVLLGFTYITLLLSIFGLISFIIPLYSFLIFLVLTLPLSVRIFIKDRLVGLLSPLIILLRDFAISLGIICGLVSLIRKVKY